MNMSSLVKLNTWTGRYKIKSPVRWIFPLSNQKIISWTLDAIAKINLPPRHHLQWKMPYSLWFGKDYNFSDSLLLPFSWIMATLLQSTKLNSDNSFLHYYVGYQLLSTSKESYYSIPKPVRLSSGISFNSWIKLMKKIPIFLYKGDQKFIPSRQSPMKFLIHLLTISWRLTGQPSYKYMWYIHHWWQLISICPIHVNIFVSFSENINEIWRLFL